MPQPVPPRYCPGWELPPAHSMHGAPGHDGWPGRALPDDLLPPEKWGESVAWRLAVDLLNNGFFQEAGEVLEGLWRGAREENPLQARFLQGFIMLAASRVHISRGRKGPGESLAKRGFLLLESVRSEAGPAFMGVALDVFMAPLGAGGDASAEDAGFPPVLLG